MISKTNFFFLKNRMVCNPSGMGECFRILYSPIPHSLLGSNLYLKGNIECTDISINTFFFLSICLPAKLLAPWTSVPCRICNSIPVPCSFDVRSDRSLSLLWETHRRLNTAIFLVEGAGERQAQVLQTENHCFRLMFRITF